MLATWLAAAVSPGEPPPLVRSVHRPRPQELLVDGDMVLRQYVVPGVTARGAAAAVTHRLQKYWHSLQGGHLLVAFDTVPDLPLGRTARAPLGAYATLPPLGTRIDADTILPEPAGGLDSSDTYWRVMQLVSKALVERLSPPKAGPAASARLIDLPYATSMSDTRKRLDAFYEDALLDKPILVGLAFEEKHAVQVTAGEPGTRAGTALGEALIKLCAAASRHAGLVSTHPDALVAALLCEHIDWLDDQEGGGGVWDLVAARAQLGPRMVPLLALALAAVGVSAHSPAEPSTDGAPTLVAQALRELVAGQVPGRPRLSLTAPVALYDMVHVLAHVAQLRVARMSPPLSGRSALAQPEGIMKRRLQLLRSSGGVPADTPDPASLTTCLARARRAEWLLRYYSVHTDEDAQRLFQDATRVMASESVWGWQAVSIPRTPTTSTDVIRRATLRYSGWRFCGRERIEYIDRAARVALPLIEGDKDWRLLFG